MPTSAKKKNPSSQTRCTQKHPLYPKVIDGIKNLLLRRGISDCTPNIFIETYPDIAAKFETSSLKNQISRSKAKIKTQLESQGVILPNGPNVAAQETTPGKTGKSCNPLF